MTFRTFGTTGKNNYTPLLASLVGSTQEKKQPPMVELKHYHRRFCYAKEMRDFKTGYNKNQRKLAAVIAIKPKGRPQKDGAALPPSVQQLSKLSQLQYEPASKERYIKRLEMENELMRDFLSLTERK